MDQIIEFAAKWWPTVTAVVTLAAAIAAITPSRHDDRIVQFILDVINKLALNIGKAKNADDSK